MQNKLSILVVVKNEEKQIANCLETLRFGSELILILDSCTDKTEQIAKKFRCKIFKGDWENEGERRNFGISRCKFDWILEVDADERVSQLLKKEILKVILNSKFDYHNIPVQNFIGKQVVKYGWGAYFGKSAYPGLFKKNSKNWGCQNVHPKITFNGKKGDSLKNFVKHYYCKDIKDMFDKLNNYSDARAKDILEKNIRENLFMNIRRILSRFWKCYVLRKGYKEPRFGILIAIIAAIYPLVSFLKYQNLLNK